MKSISPPKLLESVKNIENLQQESVKAFARDDSPYHKDYKGSPKNKSPMKE